MTLTHVMELTDPSKFAELLDYVGVAKKLIPEIEKRAKQVLDQTEGRNGHIFNLGHGILPTMSVEKVVALVDYVHNQSGKL